MMKRRPRSIVLNVLASATCLLGACVGGGGTGAGSKAALFDEDMTVASRGPDSVGYYTGPSWPVWGSFGVYGTAEATAPPSPEVDAEAIMLSDTAVRLDWRAEIDDRLSVIDARIKASDAYASPEQRIRLGELRKQILADRLTIATLQEDAALEVMRGIDDGLAAMEWVLARVEGTEGTDAARVCTLDPEPPLGRLDRDERC